MRCRALMVALACLAASVPSPARADSEQLAPRRLTKAHFLLDPAAQPPALSDPRWQELSLPDRWRERRPELGGTGWYRLELGGMPPSREAWALHLPNVNMNAEAWVNGAHVGTGGRFEEPVAHNFNRPLLFVFPAEMLRRDANVVHVRLHAYAHHFGLLGALEVGPEAALRGRFEWSRFVRVELARLGTLIALVASVLAGMLWLGTRRDAVYGTFALATGSWAVTSFNYWVRDLPMPHWAWERIVNLGVEWFVVLLALWAHRLEGARRPRTEAALLGFAALATALALLLPVSLFFPVFNGLHAVAFVIGSYATLRVVRIRDRFAPWERGVYAVAGGLALLFAGNDIAIQFGIGDAGRPFLMHLVAPLMLLSFGSTLMARFVRSLEQVRQQNVLAEQKVREKTTELEQNHERLRALERERAVADERERIMREMHDGLGAQLVAALAMVESEASTPDGVAMALRGALADMRAVIDSLDPGVSDLGALLGIFRARVDPLLEARGVKLQWRVGELPEGSGLGAESSLHVLRILQEAVTNAVTHARAQRVALETTWQDDGAVEIAVSDDGSGFEADALGSGRGLGNMRRRAESIGAELHVESGPTEGTRVALRIPISRAA